MVTAGLYNPSQGPAKHGFSGNVFRLGQLHLYPKPVLMPIHFDVTIIVKAAALSELLADLH